MILKLRKIATFMRGIDSSVFCLFRKRPDSSHGGGFFIFRRFDEFNSKTYL